MNDWNLISEPPPAPVQAELFLGNAPNLVVSPYRDERRLMAFWDGQDWRWMGTAHRINEEINDQPEYLPTHWRALSPPPDSAK